MITFKEYDKMNPIIWDEFKKTALEAIKKGFKHYSSKSIFEVIRWHKTGDLKSDGFKINNNYTADYARKFAETYPEHKNFFRTRVLKINK